MVMSHLGRPQEGVYDEQFSLAPAADYLRAKLQCHVRLQKDWLNRVDINDGELVILENCRFNVGEKANDDALSKKMAQLTWIIRHPVLNGLPLLIEAFSRYW